MGKRAAQGNGKYWFSAKPPSRKKKFRERRSQNAAKECENELPSTDITLMDCQVATTSKLNGVDFLTTQAVAGHSEAVEATAAAEQQQMPDGVAVQVGVDSMVDAEIESSKCVTDIYQADEASDSLADDEKLEPEAIISDESLPDLIIERVSKADTEEFESPGTRHVVDLVHMFAELHRKFDNHNPILGCTFEAFRLISIHRIGLKTRCLFKCEMCSLEQYIMSEPEESDILSVNESAVAGAVSVGMGYSQTQEMFNAMNIPFMSYGTYQQYHDKIAVGFEKAAEEEMRLAGQEEKRLAIERGDVKNGVPHIPVIADGSWMKRSYRSGKYDSPSGVGVIVGFHTQKVLFAAVRNKYCTICSIAEQKKESPREHSCFKNWGINQSSSSMESSAIAEGFLKSMEMHGLVFSSLIADGDSSVYKKILDCNPYDDTYVKKIECINHLLRNLSTKTKEVSKTKLKADSKAKINQISKSKKSIGEWRKVIEGSTLRIRTAVVKASKYRMAEEVPMSEKVERLRKDLVNIPSHVFGEHKRCAELGYFCDGTPKDGEENAVPILKELDLYDRICEAFTQLSWHAESLLYNVTSNTVENYNAIVSKFIGGKRVNFGKKNSYNARCAGSVVQFNSQESYAKLSAAMGKAPTAMVHRMQQNRKGRNLKRLEKARCRKKEPRRIYSTVGTSSKKHNSDKDYGLNCNRPDLPEDEFKAQSHLHFEKLVEQQADRDLIESRTRGQSDSGEWKSLRRKLLTASNFGKVCRMRPTTPSANTVKSIVYPQDRPLPALQYGKQSEVKARQQFEETEGVQVSACGLFIDSEHCYLAASPDGLIDEDGIIEIKCPFSARDVTPEKAIEQKLGDAHRIYHKNNPERMNENHPYFYQMQGQLHIADKQYCAFVLWTPKGMKTVKVFRDNMFWQNKMLPYLSRFYEFCMLPEIIDGRHVRNMELREPQYILDARNSNTSDNNKQ